MKKGSLLTTKQSQLLGLTPLEVDILNVASNIDSTVLTLGKELNIPRTTLYPYLDNLLQRKLIDKIVKGKRLYYRSKSREEIASLFFEMGVAISKNKTLTLPDTSTQIKIFSGIKQISEAWLLIGNQPKGSKVIGIQPSKSLEYSISKVPHAITRQNHKLIISRDIFLEGYCEEDIYSLVLGKLKSIDALEETIPDFEDRKAITYLFEKNSFNTTSELFVLSEGLLIIDWKEEFGILIQNMNIGIIIHSLLNKLRPLLKVANYNQEMDKALKSVN